MLKFLQNTVGDKIYLSKNIVFWKLIQSKVQSIVQSLFLKQNKMENMQEKSNYLVHKGRYQKKSGKKALKEQIKMDK